MRVKESDFLRGSSDYEGYCSNCDKITKEGVEPDEEDLDCPVCLSDSVMGLEIALICGYITFT